MFTKVYFFSTRSVYWPITQVKSTQSNFAIFFYFFCVFFLCVSVYVPVLFLFVWNKKYIFWYTFNYAVGEVINKISLDRSLETRLLFCPYCSKYCKLNSCLLQILLFEFDDHNLYWKGSYPDLSKSSDLRLMART